jgi:hypothetical protein
MEAVSTEGTSRATYCFKMVTRKDYPTFKSIAELQAQMRRFIKDVNRALVAINFRREPIYLTNEMLLRPQYQRYRFSIARIPELKILRRLFIGRVIHNTMEQWQIDINDLLDFNVKVADEDLLWSKNISDVVSVDTEQD